MTAEEAYRETMKARRDYVLEHMAASARNGRFEAEVWYTYMYKELEDELVADGYSVSRNEDYVVISWASPKTARIQQAGRRSVSFD